MNRASRVHFPLPLSPGSRWLPKSTPPAHSWNQVRVVALQSPLQVVTRRAVTSLKPGSCVSFHTRRNQVSVTLHTQTPPPCHHRPGRHRAPGRVPVLHHAAPPRVRRWPRWSAGTVSRSLVSAPRSVSVAPADHQTRLRDSVRPASPKFRGVHFTSVKAVDCPCPVCGNRSPAGEGCDRTGPSSRYEVGVLQPLLHCAKKSGGLRPILDLRVLNRALHKLPFRMLTQKEETHFRVRPSPRLVCSDRLKDAYFHVSILPRHRPFLRIRVRGSGISVQGPALRAVPVASCLHQSRGGGPCSPERTRGAHPQLPRRLAHTCTVSRAVARTQGLVLRHLSQLGLRVNWEKSKLVPTQRISFLGMELDSVNQTARLNPGTCSVGAELPQDFIRQDGGPTETLSEAPGAYGCSCGDSAARSAPYETASALAPWPNPEVGVGTRVLTGFRLHRPAAKPSARGQIPRSFGQECPWSRYPGMRWYSRMPRPLAGEPRTTGTRV